MNLTDMTRGPERRWEDLRERIDMDLNPTEPRRLRVTADLIEAYFAARAFPDYVPQWWVALCHFDGHKIPDDVDHDEFFFAGADVVIELRRQEAKKKGNLG